MFKTKIQQQNVLEKKLNRFNAGYIKQDSKQKTTVYYLIILCIFFNILWFKIIKWLFSDFKYSKIQAEQIRTKSLDQCISKNITANLKLLSKFLSCHYHRVCKAHSFHGTQVENSFCCMHRVTIVLFFLPWNKAHEDIKISSHIFLQDLTLYLSLKSNVENLVKKIIPLKEISRKRKVKNFSGSVWF